MHIGVFDQFLALLSWGKFRWRRATTCTPSAITVWRQPSEHAVSCLVKQPRCPKTQSLRWFSACNWSKVAALDGHAHGGAAVTAQSCTTDKLKDGPVRLVLVSSHCKTLKLFLANFEAKHPMSQEPRSKNTSDVMFVHACLWEANSMAERGVISSSSRPAKAGLQTLARPGNV